MQLLLSRVDGNTFTSPDGLRVHIKANHLPKRHACSLCGYTTNRVSHLGCHTKRKLEGHQQVEKNWRYEHWSSEPSRRGYDEIYFPGS